MSSQDLFTTTLIVIIPAIFVLLLGYFAGRAKRFDTDQVKGINELVLDFALPASLFVGIVGISQDVFTQSLSFFLALLTIFSISYLLALVIGKFLLRLNSSSATLFALGSAVPSAPFFGPSILGGLFGGSNAAIAITAASIIEYLIFVPISVILLESDRIHESGSSGSGNPSTKPKVRNVIIQALGRTGKAPYVLAPLVGLVIVLLGISVPPLIISMLTPIGHAASGVALFVAGLMLAAHKVKLNRVVSINTMLKSLGEPSVMLAFVLMFGLTNLLTAEAVVTVALPAATIATILAGRYKVYESEAASNLILTSFMMIGVVPMFQYLTALI
jgi:malonate transporter and related proteins